MKSPAAVREFFETVLQQVRHFKVDVIAGDGKAAAYMYCKNEEYQDLYETSVVVTLREMQREVRHIDYSTKSIHLSFTQQMILIVALWLSFHG